MKKLNIINDTKIYVACPANTATGGPELLHQLVYELRKLGLNAYMYYYNKTEINPIHSEYHLYYNPYSEEIDDNKKNIIIIPEVSTKILYSYNNIQKVIWWLSVDNYYTILKSKKLWKKTIKKFLYNIGYYRVYKFEKDDELIHFVQSEYAKQHLIKKGLKKIFFLGDYLNELFIKQQLNNLEKEKENIVIYNPKKGIEFTKKIIQKATNIRFVPIENMTRAEVATLLSKAKVYIDFGNHPGKDRIPREAAISGCCVITGKRGSSRYYEDVAIDEEFKFEDIDENILSIINKIQDCLNNYPNNKKKFNHYRDKIVIEQTTFINDIENIFINKKGSIVV